MSDNFYGMHKYLQGYIDYYENTNDGPGRDPRQEMLDWLRAPYNDMKNYDTLLEVIKGLVSPVQAKVWFAYPDFTMTVEPWTKAKASERLGSEAKSAINDATMYLAEQGLLIEYPADEMCNEPRYTRNYLFGLAAGYLLEKRYGPLHDELLKWWNGLTDGGESADLRSMMPEYRVAPHEGTLTGTHTHGRIPMDIDIPDKREVLDMDRIETIIRKAERIAVLDCICRDARKTAGIKTCDYPIEDVCIAFDAAADGEVDAGHARYITADETIKIIERCHDLGLMQIVSDAEHPMAMCNCCSCCCVCVTSRSRFEDTILKPSRFIPDTTHIDKCIGCGSCAKVCPLGVIEMTANGPVIKSQQCMGCGLCASRCPKGVLKMHVRPGAPKSPAVAYQERVYI